MNSDQFRNDIRALQQQIDEFQHSQASIIWDESAAMLENLKAVYEEMRTSLMFAHAIEAKLIQQNQRLTEANQHYRELFQSSPIAHLVTDAHGIILEGNRAIAHLLNVSPEYLLGKSLITFVAEADRQAVLIALSNLAYTNNVQTWRLSLCPRNGTPFEAALHVAIARGSSDDRPRDIKGLEIAVYDLSQLQPNIGYIARSFTQLSTNTIHRSSHSPTDSLRHSLNGLQVLVVDDEADAREFITAVLESHGVRVTAVATPTDALKALEHLHPDMLISDIRMPDSDGYALIRKVRELETQWDMHIPAVAFTAYHLEESREKALCAGFEAYMSKLAEPDEFVQTVARLTGRQLQ